MKLTADWLSDTDTQKVCGALTGGGFQALFVGGCVRNALLAEPVHDIDIATDARPEDVMRLAGDAGLKPIPTGIDHGTITVVAGGKPFEVTTFRQDVETDGRHARVAFSDDIETDAARRDFTMNAIYADATGEIVDPLNGMPDLMARRVRFIGDAGARIREDYLRILRFFRFTAWYGEPTIGYDPDTLAEIATHLDGLDQLAAERITSEMVKLLAAPDPATALGAMEACGVLNKILPGAHVPSLALLVHHSEHADIPLYTHTLLAALMPPNDAARLRLDKATLKGWALLRTLFNDGMGPAEIAYRHGATEAEQACLLQAAFLEQPLTSFAQAIDQGARARFPVTAQDLMPDYQGKALGDKLRELEALWIASGFALTAKDLLT